MDAANNAHPSSMVPSLKDLSLKLAIKQFVDEGSDFTGLDIRLQSLLFGSFRDEINRLKAVERSWSRFKSRCPRLDREIYIPSDRIPNEDDWEEEKDDDEKINPYKVMQIAYNKWSYVNPGEDERNLRTAMRRSSVSETEQRVDWYSGSNLYYDKEERRLVAVDRRETLHNLMLYLSPRLPDLISSQLLLYRTTIIFGMPPADESDGYKCCWKLMLRHHSGNGTLELDEHKGCPCARFSGSKDASDDALDLINFLTYLKMPHTYDGIIAGTIA